MNLTQGHNDFYYLLKKHLKPGVYDLMGAGENAPTVAVLRELENELSVRFPEDFVSFSVSGLGGLYINAKKEHWPPSREYEVRPAWAFASGLWVYGMASDIPDFMNLRMKALQFKEETGQVFAPCLNVMMDADFYGFLPDGQLGRWNHEEDIVESIDEPFIDALDREMGELAIRQSQMETERHKFEQAAAENCSERHS